MGVVKNLKFEHINFCWLFHVFTVNLQVLFDVHETYCCGMFSTANFDMQILYTDPHQTNVNCLLPFSTSNAELHAFLATLCTKFPYTVYNGS